MDRLRRVAGPGPRTTLQPSRANRAAVLPAPRRACGNSAPGPDRQAGSDPARRTRVLPTSDTHRRPAPRPRPEACVPARNRGKPRPKPQSSTRLPGQAAQPRTEKPHRWDRSPPTSSTPLPPTGTGLRTGGGVEAVQPNDGPGLRLGTRVPARDRDIPGPNAAWAPPHPEKHPSPLSGNLTRFPGT